MRLHNCHHLCTKALKNRLLCCDDSDYTALWNILAVCAIIKGVKFYCLCLMSNHIHILLHGDEIHIQDFFSLVKKKIGMYLRQKYPDDPLPSLEYELFPVSDRKAFCREVAYILRNPYKAGIAGPFSYRWNSSSVYFNPFPPAGSPLSGFSIKERRELLQSRLELPDNVLVSNGIILPQSFVDASFVERMFDNSSILFFNLIKSWNLEDVVRASHGEQISDKYTDTEVQAGIMELCRDIFRTPSPAHMDKTSLGSLVRRVYARFGCTRKQLERLLPVDGDMLDRLL